MREGERQIFTAENALAIRDTLSGLLAGVELEDGVSRSTLEMLAKFGEGEGDKLVLDLRCPEGPVLGSSPKLKNLQACHLGRVLIVTGEVTDPRVFQQIEERCHLRPSPQHLVLSLWDFV